MQLKVIFTDEVYQSRAIVLAEVGGYQVLNENDINIGWNVSSPQTDILNDIICPNMTLST